MRATINRGEDAHTDGKFGLSEKSINGNNKTIHD